MAHNFARRFAAHPVATHSSTELYDSHRKVAYKPSGGFFKSWIPKVIGFNTKSWSNYDLDDLGSCMTLGTAPWGIWGMGHSAPGTRSCPEVKGQPCVWCGGGCPTQGLWMAQNGSNSFRCEICGICLPSSLDVLLANALDIRTFSCSSTCLGVDLGSKT